MSECRVVVVLDENRYRVVCKSGATIEWLLSELANRYRRQRNTSMKQRILNISTESAAGGEVVVEALLTHDGSFLDPLDCVADVCEPDELLIGVVSSQLRLNSGGHASSPHVNVEQMVLKLKTLASATDSSTSTDSPFIDDNELDDELDDDDEATDADFDHTKSPSSNNSNNTHPSRARANLAKAQFASAISVAGASSSTSALLTNNVSNYSNGPNGASNGVNQHRGLLRRSSTSSSPLAKSAHVINVHGADNSDDDDDLSNTPSPGPYVRSPVLTSSAGGSISPPPLTNLNSHAASATTLYNDAAPIIVSSSRHANIGATNGNVGTLEDSVDITRKRFSKETAASKDKLPDAGPSVQSSLGRRPAAPPVPSSILSTSTEIALKKLNGVVVPVFGLLPSTSSERGFGVRALVDDDDDSELAMAVNIDVPMVSRRFTFDVLVDDTCAAVIRKVQEMLPGMAPPAGHCFTLQLVNGTVAAVSKTMLDLRVQPRELLTVVTVKATDANKEVTVQNRELLRKVSELDRVVQQKQQQQLLEQQQLQQQQQQKPSPKQAAAKAPTSAAPVVSAPVPVSGMRVSPNRLHQSAQAAPQAYSSPAATTSPLAAPTVAASPPAVAPTAATAAAAAVDKGRPKSRSGRPVGDGKSNLHRRHNSDAKANAPVAQLSALPLVDSPPVVAPAAPTSPTTAAAKPLSREPSVEDSQEARPGNKRQQSGSFFGRIKEHIKSKDKGSKSKLSRLVTLQHLSLMEPVQFSLKQTVGEVLEDIALQFGMLRESHSAADLSSLHDNFSLYATEVSEGDGERATLLDVAATMNTYSAMLERCNFAVRKKKGSVRVSGEESPTLPGLDPLSMPSSMASSTSSASQLPTPSSSDGGRKPKKRNRGGSGKRRPRGGSGETRPPIVERHSTEESLFRSSSPADVDDSPRVALSGTIADLKAQILNTAGMPASESGLVEQNETLRSMLAQTLERLERATAQLAARASPHSSPQQSLSSSSLSPPTSNGELSATAMMLSPRSASKLMRHTMLARSLSSERGARLSPRVGESSGSDDDPKKWVSGVPSFTDDENTRRQRMLGNNKVVLLTRSGSFPPPDSERRSSLAISYAATLPSGHEEGRPYRADSDHSRQQPAFVPRAARTMSGSDDTNYESDSSDDDDDRANSGLPWHMGDLNWDGARLRPTKAVSHSDMGARVRAARVARLDPPPWVGSDGGDEKPLVRESVSFTTKRNYRRHMARAHRRAFARQRTVVWNPDSRGAVLARMLDEQLQRADANRGIQRDNKPLPPRGRSFDSKVLVITSDMTSEVDMRECLSEVAHTAVYRCVVRGATFACKVFRSDSASRGEREAAWREVSLLATLSHRNVVQFAGQQTMGSELRTYLEFFLTTLSDVLAIRRDSNDDLSAADAAQFSLEIARGLRYLHELESPVALLGLAPIDIFYQANDYSGDVVLKIGSFTEARRLGRRTDETSDSTTSNSSVSLTKSTGSKPVSPLIHKPPLISRAASTGDSDLLPLGWFEELSRRRGARAALTAPELHTLESVPIQLRSDIWSFGMVLFELIFLRTPYEREQLEIYDIAQLVERGVVPQVANDERASQPQVQPLLRMLAHCLSSQGTDRPSAAKLCTSLARFLKVIKS